VGVGFAIVAAAALVGCGGSGGGDPPDAVGGADADAGVDTATAAVDAPQAPDADPAGDPPGDPPVGVVTDNGVPSTRLGQSPPPPPVCSLGDTTVAYNAMPFGVVNCVNPSMAFEGNFINEFGDEVQLAGTGTSITTLNVLFASFACQEGHWFNGDCVSAPGATFTVPVTANIFAAADCAGTPCPGPLLGTVTETLTIPFRPSADPVNCPGPAGRWFNPGSGLCENKIATVQTFNFSGVTVPADRQVIWTVSYNTTHAGPSPIGEGAACFATSGGCPYDSLNVGAMSHPNAPYAGIDVDPDVAFMSIGLPPPPVSPVTGFTDFRPEGEIITN
jgi:hypothetical protein